MKNARITISFVFILLATIAILIRLYYWQVIAAEELEAMGEKQHLRSFEVSAQRGEIRTSDNFPLVMNKETFVVFAYLPQIDASAKEISLKLSPILASLFEEKESTQSSTVADTSPQQKAQKEIENKLKRSDVSWVSLAKNLNHEQKKAIEELDLNGIGTEQSFRREYPEGRLAANILGFVGSDTSGNQKGYFGLEGNYNLELTGRPGILIQERDASGRPILIGKYDEQEPKAGRHLVLNVNRAIQRIVEQKLGQALEKYGAKTGEVVVIEPKSGAVIAMASLPDYEPERFLDFDKSLYKNPIVFNTYEPGSTFKVLTMAAAIDAKAVKPETKCDICDKPLNIGAYTVRTWNNEYQPDPTMKEVIEHSDNLGMVFAVSKLGKDKLVEYLANFGIGKETGIDLEEEAAPLLRSIDQWKEIDLATASFGQGVAVTAIQMVRAVAAIANNGILMTPYVVDKVISDETNVISPKEEARVVSKETAEIITKMMVNAVENGEAKWAKPKGYKIAGKTGTAQIPVAGHYDDEKTIASFVGFAPANNPKFVMLVKLREPESSPWGSETAAPLWFDIAKDLFHYYSIQPLE